MIRPISASIDRLIKKLTYALAATDSSVDDPPLEDIIFRLLSALFRTDFGSCQAAFLIDPSVNQDCNSGNVTWIGHLWSTLQNWTLRVHPSAAARLFQCLTDMIRFCRRALPDDEFSILITQPYNFLVLLYGLESDFATNSSETRTSILQLADEILSANEQHLRLYGTLFMRITYGPRN